mmetsp:Transcript_64657/g.117997  ORF Transcript_64657/g.117997 Transcript_64657/m.117997 type:complete len:109 (-) Transcript_64657:43-369(-)
MSLTMQSCRRICIANLSISTLAKKSRSMIQNCGDGAAISESVMIVGVYSLRDTDTTIQTAMPAGGDATSRETLLWTGGLTRDDIEFSMGDNLCEKGLIRPCCVSPFAG